MSRPQEVPNKTNKYYIHIQFKEHLPINFIFSSTCLKIRFPRLEKLWLDDNRLTDTTTFAILAGLRKWVLNNIINILL